MTNAPERELEPVFCGECQNSVGVSKARVLDGQVLCPKDLSKRSFFDRLRARKLPQNYKRRSGRTFRSLFTSIAALMLLVGIAFVWRAKQTPLPIGPVEGAAAVEAAADMTAPGPVLLSAPDKQYLVSGICMILAGVIVAISGMFVGDALDLLLDISDELRHSRR